jgi:hypothetical protein
VALALIAVASLALVACTGTTDEAAPPATTAPLGEVIPAEDTTVVTLAVPEGFVVPDTRGVVLAPVPSDPKPQPAPPPLPVQGGEATITGQVTGPDGPAKGVTVRLQRIVGDRSGTYDVRTGSNGRFDARGLLGGRYRVRAFLPPDLASIESQLTFVAEDQTVDLRVGIERHDALVLQAAADSPGWTVGGRIGLRVLLLRESVDGDGIIRGEPIPSAQVLASMPGGVRLITDLPGITGQDGAVTLVTECVTAGQPGPVAVTSAETSVSASLPRCDAASSPTTEPEAVDELPVGGSFTTPAAGPIGAGTYQAIETSCRTSYTTAGADGSRSVAAGRGLTFDAPVVDLQPAGGSGPCTYVRVR